MKYGNNQKLTKFFTMPQLNKFQLIQGNPVIMRSMEPPFSPRYNWYRVINMFCIFSPFEYVQMKMRLVKCTCYKWYLAISKLATTGFSCIRSLVDFILSVEIFNLNQILKETRKLQQTSMDVP